MVDFGNTYLASEGGMEGLVVFDDQLIAIHGCHAELTTVWFVAVGKSPQDG